MQNACYRYKSAIFYTRVSGYIYLVLKFANITRVFARKKILSNQLNIVNSVWNVIETNIAIRSKTFGVIYSLFRLQKKNYQIRLIQ